MAQITQEQVIEVATAKIGRGEDRIERVYRWQFEQALAVVRATFVLAGSIIGATLTALVQRAGPVAPWQTLIVAAAFAGSVGTAVYQNARLSQLYGNYLESLRVLAVVQRMLETEEWTHSRFS